MEWAVPPKVLRPVTIEDVISPVPMNPNFMECLLSFAKRRARCLSLQVVSLEFPCTAQLNDDSAFLRCDKMRDAGRNDDETTCRVGFEFR